MSDARRQAMEEVLRILREAIQSNSHSSKERVRHLSSALSTGKFSLSPFRSSCYGMGTNKSDLDVYFRFMDDADGCEEFEKHSQMHIDTIRLIESAVKKADGFTNVTSIARPKMKVPVAKCTVKVGCEEIDVDISCNSELGLANTRLLKRYCTCLDDNLIADLGM
ncbi:hypothetical protein PMAYCL1PPCAC_14102, partial [Pristionchus mayeri]